MRMNIKQKISSAGVSAGIYCVCVCVFEVSARVRERRPNGSGYGPVIVEINKFL